MKASVHFSTATTTNENYINQCQKITSSPSKTKDEFVGIIIRIEKEEEIFLNSLTLLIWLMHNAKSYFFMFNL